MHAILRDLLKKVKSYPPESLGNTIAGKLAWTVILSKPWFREDGLKYVGVPSTAMQCNVASCNVTSCSVFRGLWLPLRKRQSVHLAGSQPVPLLYLHTQGQDSACHTQCSSKYEAGALFFDADPSCNGGCKTTAVAKLAALGRDTSVYSAPCIISQSVGDR